MPHKDPVLYKTYQDRYRAEHRETLRIHQRGYRVLHREYYRAQSRAYYLSHKTESRLRGRLNARKPTDVARRKAYKQAHREHIKLWMRAYKRRRPELTQMESQRRRALLAEVESSLTAQQWSAIKAAYGHRCAYCGRSGIKLTQDHVVPLSKRGPHSAANVVPACGPCNYRKGAKPPPRMPSLRLML